jgi:REP element-mobilizing transposase RayT
MNIIESGDGSLTHFSFEDIIITKIGIWVIVMPRRGRKLSVSQTYHVMVRGNERRNIFLDDEDRTRFIDTLHVKGQADKFTLYAYCLMDNHVHLLIGEGTDDISKIMKRINVSYAYYFNRKYHRIGHLFQDRFKSEGIEDDTYLLSVIRYIHNNPVRANIVKHAGEYKWSSYGIYTNFQRDIRDFINKESILEHFSSNQARAIELFIEYSKIENADTFIDIKKADDERKPIREGLDAKEFIESYFNKRGIGLEDINLKKNKVDRSSLIKQLKDKLGLSVREIANLLDIDRNIVQRTK